MQDREIGEGAKNDGMQIKKIQKQVTDVKKEIVNNRHELEKMQSILNAVKKYMQEQADPNERNMFMENFYWLSESISALYTLEKKKRND